MISCRVDIIVSSKFMDYQIIQSQYDRIYSYFKTTTEPFDFLEWDGRVAMVWNEDKIIEEYSLEDLGI